MFGLRLDWTRRRSIEKPFSDGRARGVKRLYRAGRGVRRSGGGRNTLDDQGGNVINAGFETKNF
jgi:hypothetical protein